ncbi:helix-turn-helix domain-containing protein [Desulfitobacterium sp. PCE1]|uniref:helix-turn-helix domain-containing protein n=1 Tax=Desulfitobacterium sp. PCE1 TaxID=146907 RepID=UPI00035EFBFB|nr:helix-turn-helix transcriptional regulator [Desulfitobacterium sp. PCE1]
MVGENIKQYLENKGVTQVFLAEKAKISTGAINQMLNGKRKIIVEEYLALKCLKLIAAYRT